MKETGLTSGVHLSVIERGVGWQVRWVNIGKIWAGGMGCRKKKKRRLTCCLDREKKLDERL
jgi:hypothetical protein